MPTFLRRRSTRRSLTSTSAEYTNRRTLERVSAIFCSAPRRRPDLGAAALFCAIALLLASCGGGHGGDSTATAVPTTAQASTGTDDAPLRDLQKLAQEFRGVPADLPRTVQLPPLATGDEQQLQVLVLSSDPNAVPERKTVTARVAAVTDHAYLLVDTASTVDQSVIDRAAGIFEDTVWPRVTSDFGAPASPGIDGDPRILILHTDLGASVGGYVTDEDSYRTEATPRSNQREMLYISANLLFSAPDYTHVVAHELQHLIHGKADQGEDTWVNEGLSEAAGRAATGGTEGFHTDFLNNPDVQLTTWSSLGDSIAHYGAASLFISYLLEQTGAPPSQLLSEPGDSVEGIREFLTDVGSTRTFEDMVADWCVANLVDQPSGPYGYSRLDAQTTASERISAAGPTQGDVHQFAADYLELDAADFPSGATLTFDGADSVEPVAAMTGANGAFWWSGAGDNIDSTLTRELDLTGVSAATLTFRTWYDIERRFDWGQLAVSRDGGTTWTALAGRLTTTDDPMSVGYGPGYDGHSGAGDLAGWVDESVDLSAYAGSKVLVRWELITDDSSSRPGWAIDDITVPETGFIDNAGSDAGGWQRAGWRRVSEPLEQRFELRLVTFENDAPTVNDVPVAAGNTATIDLSGLGSQYDRAVVAIVAVTDGTSGTAPYQYEVR